MTEERPERKMSARRNDGGQANKNTPARTGPIIEGEIPFEFPRPDIQHNPRGCGCLSRGLRTRASRRRISLAEQDADHTVSTPALLGDVEIAAPIFMPQARGQELQCRVGQVLHAATRARNARDDDQHRHFKREQNVYLEGYTQCAALSGVFRGRRHAAWYRRSTKGET